eukprot:SAG31_NODE_258_length_18937_cov_61.688555_15_plen_49_part_00
MQSRALLYGFSPGSCSGVNPTNLTEVEEDVVWHVSFCTLDNHAVGMHF